MRPALALLLLLAACSEAGPGTGPGPGEEVSFTGTRYECVEGCGTYKTVGDDYPPPPCCGLPMDLAERVER